MRKNGETGYQFGTFKGVFTPSILTILGVVMYLRFGWVLGNVGLPLTLFIVSLSCAITFMTGLAIAALATNMRIGTGGAYYIISRSLGVEIGASIGLPLFLAQALGISFYVAGFSESIVGIWPNLDATVVGVTTLVLLTVLAFFSANLALKMQFFILAAIVISLVSFFMGDTPDALHQSGEATLQKAYVPFWAVFAVFFPAVTGIEAGISLSGDLKDPGKSLAKGTLAAVLVGYAVYLCIPCFLAYVLPDPRDLSVLQNPLIMRDVARWGDAVLAGLWGASISSALGAILGAPRTLQALAGDRVLPQFIGRTYGEGKDPRIATVVSFAIALAGILLGDLNVIAPVLSMFFLTSYGLLNVCATVESAIGSPRWRPSIKLPWQVHLVGAVACFIVMLMINTMATFVALGVAAMVYVMMHRRRLRARWGDVRYGVAMMMVQNGLRHLSRSEPDIRTWKPNILVLSGVPTARWYLIELAHAISQGRSLMTVATVLSGSDISDDRVLKLTNTINAYLHKEEIDTLVTVLRADTMAAGLQSLVSAYGFGPLVPNTVMLGETERIENLDEYVALVRRVCSLKRNLVIIRENSTKRDLDVDSSSVQDASRTRSERNSLSSDSGDEGKRIDVWWRGQGPNAGLMLALAFQLQRSGKWNDHQLNLKTIAQSDSGDVTAMQRHLEQFVERERLTAEIEVTTALPSESPFDAIKRSSADAALVVLGIRGPAVDESLEDYKAYYQLLLRETEGLPLAAFVFAAQELPFKEIFST